MTIQKIHKTYILSFLFALHVAIAAYINSSFLTQIVSEKYVGLIFSIGSIISLVFLSQSSSILKSFGNRKLALSFISMNILGVLGMILSNHPILTGISFVVFNVTNILFFFCIDIFVEHFSERSTIGKARGVYLTVYNIGWMTSPFITGFLTTLGYGYTPVYMMSLLIALIVMIGFIFWIPSFTDASYAKVPFTQAYKFLREKHHLGAINIINFILQFFYVWMVIYTPIYLIEHIGFTWKSLSVIFTVMLIPFVVMPISISRAITRFNLHKTKLIIIGTLIMSSATVLIAFNHTNSIVLWAVLLCMTRIGASTVEAVSEIYFFTHVKEEDAHLLSLFRDMAPLSYLVAPLLGTAVLSLLPFNYLFIALGIIVLSILYYVPRLKHSSDELHLSN
ncbi:MAG: MFS transporter [Candidatus Paceibacterota bacterium]